MADEKKHLSAAVALLVAIKRNAMNARRNGPRDGLVTGEGKCLFSVEGDVEEFLNNLALADPALAAPWKMTPAFAEDHGL